MRAFYAAALSLLPMLLIGNPAGAETLDELYAKAKTEGALTIVGGGVHVGAFGPGRRDRKDLLFAHRLFAPSLPRCADYADLLTQGKDGAFRSLLEINGALAPRRRLAPIGRDDHKMSPCCCTCRPGPRSRPS